MVDFIDQILHEKKIAYAVFDKNLRLTRFSQSLKQINPAFLIEKTNELWDIFPELVGSEEVIEEILGSRKKKYLLEKLSIFTEIGDKRHYNLTLLPLKGHPTGLLCVVADTTIETSLEQEIRQQKYEIELLQASLAGYGSYQGFQILGTSEKIQQVRDTINKILNIRQAILLLSGESGTGKNLIARIIHQRSIQSKAPFVEINCAAIPETLLESEIFGHEKGAFTNAFLSKKGLLEEADGGTLFLDEIGELPPPIQAKFLSFLETKTFRRLGSTKEKEVDIRIIAATNRDLKEAVAKKEFREDLFYRLNVINIKLPPLRELGQDVVILTNHFIHLYANDFRKKVKGLTESAKTKLLKYSWPGNVRELRNVIERAVIFAGGEKLTENEIILVEEKTATPPVDTIQISEKGFSLYQVESQLLKDALTQTNGNQSKAARLLGLTLDTFRYRLKKYHISH